MNYIILIFIMAALLLLFKFPQQYRDTFDESGTEFVPLGYKRYGLRGELLFTNPIPDCYYDQYSCYTSTAKPYFSPYDL